MVEPRKPAVKAIAFYLPQFHPIPENDRWWGKGFTEWTNVTRATSLFPGHWQPHLPADLGFYDLRLSSVLSEQAQLARRYGIHGFCYYHYWHHGKRLLHLPIDEMLRSGQPRFPFCLCWANHNWTRNWDDGNRELLSEQRYSLHDHLEHIRWLAKVFLDERYIRIDGKPLFLIFRASAIRYLDSMVEMWRDHARKLGVGEIFLAELESQEVRERIDPRQKGLDAVVEFQPDLPTLMYDGARCAAPAVPSLVGGRGGRGLNHYVFDYEEVVRRMREKSPPDSPFFRCVTPSWDNTARRRIEGVILHGSTPELYERWLADVVEETHTSSAGERLVFLNAWNEWAEGNHLEPCQRWGHAYLQATRRALANGASALWTSHITEEVGA
jgi:lipopolysaccharide biosynthesis protein